MEQPEKDQFKDDLKDFFRTAQEVFMNGLSIDTVIFGFHDRKLKVLLVRLEESSFYSLPGGYIRKQEHVDDAALRILKERTGLKNIYLEQFYTAGDVSRADDINAKQIIQGIIGSGTTTWLDQRFISICYYALVDDTKVKPVLQPFFSEYRWVEVERMPKLLYDHRLIVEKALERLRMDLDRKLVVFNLMPDSFTMNELQKLYEAIYQKKMVRSNFQRKMLSLGILERLEKRYEGKSHKAPYLYRFIGYKH